MQINGRNNNSQLCLPNNCNNVNVAKSLTGRFQTLRNNSQQHETTCNNMQQGVQADATCNIQQCSELLANHVPSVWRGFTKADIRTWSYCLRLEDFRLPRTNNVFRDLTPLEDNQIYFLFHQRPTSKPLLPWRIFLKSLSFIFRVVCNSVARGKLVCVWVHVFVWSFLSFKSFKISFINFIF